MLAPRSQGLSYEAIAERLNEEDMKPRTSERAGSECRWFGTMLSRILRANAG